MALDERIVPLIAGGSACASTSLRLGPSRNAGTTVLELSDLEKGRVPQEMGFFTGDSIGDDIKP